MYSGKFIVLFTPPVTVLIYIVNIYRYIFLTRIIDTYRYILSIDLKYGMQITCCNIVSKDSNFSLGARIRRYGFRNALAKVVSNLN